MASRPGNVELNEHHTEMVKRYLRFAQVQRKEHVKELDQAVDDYKDTRIQDDENYSADEVKDLLENLNATIKADLHRNLQRVSHSNVVLLRSIFAQAEANDLVMKVDTSTLEDEMLLSVAAQLEEESEKQTKAPEALPAVFDKAESMRSLMKLPTLDSAKQAENMSVEVGVLKQRVAELQQELVAVKREKTELNDQLLAANDSIKEQSQATVVAQKQKSMEELEQQLQDRLDKAPQFKSMKDMLQKKNTQIKQYKELLEGYGWVDPDNK